MPKSPFMPKFVDPKTFISKKTDMLSNMFSGLGPVAYNMADTKPIMSYGASGPSLDNTDSALFNKRDVLQGGKGKVIDSSGMYKRGMFGPFTPKFGPMGPTSPMGPKFGPITPFSSPEMMPDFMATAPFSRRRRSIEASSADSINTIPGSLSYPKIIESLSATKPAADVPKEYLPGMFGSFGPGGPFAPSGSFGPGGPFAPVVDPSAIISKKSEFLDTLFKNIATSTPATTTDVPTPSTIVPPSFWIPSSVIPGPTEYTQKVSDFLDKLFDSVNGTALEASDDLDAKSDFMRSLKPDFSPDKIARSLDDASSIADAKDAIVDTILSELGNLKSDMIATLNDLIAYEKTAAAATTKKPFKPFASIFAKPTVDPTLPFQQRMTVLSQVFDMLTDLQKNISVVAKSAMATNASTPNNPELSKAPQLTNTAVDASPINNTLLNAILKKISAIETATPASYSASYPASYSVSYPATPVKETPIMSRALPKGPTSFWVSYSGNSAPAVKRQVNDDLQSYFGIEDDNDRHDHRQYKRGVQMQMHQGYQSLPAGSVESVQAGGGSTPGHQGGGIKLLVSAIYFKRRVTLVIIN